MICMKKILGFIFAFEIVAMFIAFASFKLIADRGVAAVLAGTCFVVLGFVIFGIGLKDGSFRKTFTFWLGCIHLFVISLPMLVSRILTWGTDFHTVNIFGVVPGPVFHRYSEMFYLVLVIGTVIDRIRLRAAERRA